MSSISIHYIEGKHRWYAEKLLRANFLQVCRIFTNANTDLQESHMRKPIRIGGV